MTPEEEAELRQELLVSDLDLRRKQGFWETPRNIAILLGATAALASAVGYKIGSTTPPNPQVIIQFPSALAPQLGAPTITPPAK